MYLFFMIKLLDWRVLWRHFRSTSGFIVCIKFYYQKIRRKMSGGASILWVLSSILTLMSVFWQIKAQLLNTCYVDDTLQSTRRIKVHLIWLKDVNLYKILYLS